MQGALNKWAAHEKDTEEKASSCKRAVDMQGGFPCGLMSGGACAGRNMLGGAN
ncbi:hypothetical protein M8C21_002945 [Ambrosia artemisiifolia]|uniref:Uncharacterized protein n=1 Tax=Ambrosia artemisiifolia TaxID=4212 RepID=A0AAD5C2C9_AMBAR|nr:hypothetical protein M8C21_002945 [Ambrosia artemisiifolia]